MPVRPSQGTVRYYYLVEAILPEYLKFSRLFVKRWAVCLMMHPVSIASLETTMGHRGMQNS
jgi:hypothetical protein